MADLKDFQSSVAIVVSSCDAFFDAWRPFARFFEKFWNDCPLEVYLLTNRFSILSPRFKAIQLGEDHGWSSNLLVALDRIPHSHVLYFQEDYFLTAPVVRQQLAEDFAQVVSSGADSLCFRARSGSDISAAQVSERISVVPLESDARTRCQVTLWKRSSLQSILRAGETAWNFEARGSARTQEMQILSYLRRDNTPIPYLMSAISRGLWMRDAMTLCREHGVELSSSFRPIFSPHAWQRRLLRALGRWRLKGALRKQADRSIEL
ncbi:MAG: hypothetical protein H0X40_17720 [Chthoniobacterales bacterium]|nr:hypothetical protein [Chthoniobacterales bacterium]